MKWIAVPVLALVALVAAPTLGSAGQQSSLADVARREAERRKAVKAPAKVYTNDDVPKGTLTVTAPPPLVEVGPDDEPAKDETATGEPAPDAPTEAPQDEASWRKRFADARADLTAQREALDSVQALLRVALEQWAVAPDAERRAALDRERDEAAAELTKAREVLGAREQALAALEKEADAAGVPVEWRQ